jgi:hypothetical protein
MRTHFHRPSAGLVVAAIALFLAIGGSAAAASGMFSGSQIEPNSIPLNRLSGDARQALNQAGPRGQQGSQGDDGQTGDRGKQGADGDRGAAGSKGETGATGATGATGLTGAAGAEGPAGADGTQGPAGDIGPQGLVGPAGAAGADPNRLSQVSSLDPNRAVAAPAWAAATGTCGGSGPAGTASIDAGGLEIGAPANSGISGFGGTEYNPPSGITLSGITALSYTERYEGATTSNAPYVEIDLANTTTLEFIPADEPAGSAVASGTWATWDVMAPTSTFVVNHTGGQVAFSNLPNGDAADAVADIEIEAGCSNGTAASTSTISSVVLDAGSQLQNFRFGS